MSQYTPKSKGVATLTARLLEANAKDIRRNADALDHAAYLYRQGDYKNAHEYADFAYRNTLVMIHEWVKLRMRHLHVYRQPPPHMPWLRGNNSVWWRNQIKRAKSLEPLDPVRKP